jgi:hypothetical protein
MFEFYDGMTQAATGIPPPSRSHALALALEARSSPSLFAVEQEHTLAAEDWESGLSRSMLIFSERRLAGSF